MAWVQDNLTTSSGTATPTISFAALPAAGDLVLVSYTAYLNSGTTPTTPSVSDNQGGTSSDYVLIASQVTTAGADNYRHALFYRANLSAPSGTFTVTVTQSGSHSCSIAIGHANEVPASSPIDQSAGATGSSTAPSVTLPTTTTAKCLIVGSMTHQTNSPVITADATNLPILARKYEDTNSSEAQSVALRRVAATGAYTASWGVASSVFWSAIACAISQAGTARSSLVGMGTPAYTATASTALTPAIPVGCIQDDILLLVGFQAGNVAGTTPTSSGVTWANIATLTGNNTVAQRTEAYWCRVPSGGVASVSFTFGTTAIAKGARVYAIGGCPTAGDPWDVLSRSANATVDTTTEFTNITTTADNEVALALGFHDDDLTAASLISGWRKPAMYNAGAINTAGSDVGNTTLGNDLGFFVQVRNMEAAGSVGTATVTVTATTAVSTGIAIAFQVAAPPGVTVTPSPVSSATTVVAPTVVQASLSLTPTPVAAAASRLGPTVLAASITTPTPAAAVAARVNPTVVAASITATPSPAAAAASVVAPTVVRTTITTTPAPAAAAAARINPTVQAHAIVAPSPAAAATGIVNPTLAPNAVSLPYADDFTGSPNGAATIVDTTSEISVVNNRLYVEGDGPATWTSVRYSHGPFDRSALGGFSALVRATNYSQTNGGFRVSLSPSATDPADAAAGDIHTDNQGSGNYQLFATDERVNVPTTHSIDYLYSIVPRAGGGFFCLVSGGEYGAFPEATLVNVTSSEVDALLWLHLASKQARFHADFVRAFGTAALPTALTTRFGPALAADTYDRGSLGTTTEFGAKTYATSGTVGITSNELSLNNGATVLFDPGAHGRWIELTITSASSNFAIFFRNIGTTASTGFSAFFDTSASGIWDEAGGFAADQTGAYLWPGGTHKVRIHDRGGIVQTYLDGQLVATVNSPGYGGQYGVGITNYSGVVLTVNDFAVWADTVTLTSDFGPVPDVPTGNGSATFTETFPGADGASLPVAWTTQSGTWEQRSGHGRMTSAAVSGIATVETGMTDHEVKARIYHPAAPPSYPPDWFEGLILRFTSTNSFVQAHALYQNTGAPSNEVEVRETVGGVSTLINYVNLGNLYTPSGSNVLRAAANGAEIAVYVDDVLVVQTTTSVTGGTKAGIGVNDATPYGQPSWDDIEVRATGLLPLIITPSSVSGAASLVAPSVVLGTILFTPTPASAASARVNPTVVQASLSITPTPVSAAAARVNPTTVQASLTLTVAAALARALGVDPSIIAGGSISGGIVSTASSVVAPTVVHGPLALTVTPAAARALGIDPSITIVTLPITPVPATASASLAPPLIVGGPVTVLPTPASAVAALVSPSVLRSSLTLSVVAAASRALGVDPMIVANALLSPAPAAVRALALDPIARQASLTLIPPPASAAAAHQFGALILTSLVYAPPPVSAVAHHLLGSVDVGTLFVVAGAVASRAQLVAPTILFGSIVASPSPISAAAGVSAPVVVRGSLIAAPQMVSARTAAVAEAVLGALTLLPVAAQSGAQTGAVVVVRSSIVLTLQPAVARASLTTASVVLGSLLVVPEPVTLHTDTMPVTFYYFQPGDMVVTERDGAVFVVTERDVEMGVVEREATMIVTERP